MTDMDLTPMIADPSPSELLELEGYIVDLEGAIKTMERKAATLANASERRGRRIDAKLHKVDLAMTQIALLTQPK